MWTAGQMFYSDKLRHLAGFYFIVIFKNTSTSWAPGQGSLNVSSSPMKKQ